MTFNLNQRGASKVDVILIIVILASVGMIAYKFLLPKAQDTSTSTLTQNVPLTPVNTAPVPAASPAPSSLSMTDDQKWAKLTSDPIMQSSRVRTADGCPSSFNQKLQAFWTSNPERLEQIRAKQPQVFWALKDFLCLSVGQKLPLYSFGKESGVPVVSYLTTMTVADIISIEIRKIPAAYLASQNSSVDKLEKYLAPKRKIGPGARDNIIRLTTHVSEPPKPNEAPPLAAYGKVIYKENRKAFLESHPKIAIIDVRSAPEFAKGSLPKAINIPFTPAPLKSNSFSYEVKNQDLANSAFDVSRALSLATSDGLVIVGGPPTDGRAFWATQFLSEINKGNLYFFYEGI